MLSIPVSLLTSACITGSNLRTNMRVDSKFSKNTPYLIVFIGIYFLHGRGQLSHDCVTVLTIQENYTQMVDNCRINDSLGP